MTAAPLPLYDYQEELVTEVQQALALDNSVLATAPTGSGKTVTFSDIIRRCRLRELRCDVIVHREELVEQSARSITRQTGEEPGIVWRDRQEWDRPVRIITHGTLQARTELPAGVHRPHVLILDEAHHAAAPGWRHVISLLQPRWLIGFTATPFRADRTPLVPEPFARTIRTVTPAELIERGHLVPPVVVSPMLADPFGNPQKISRAANLPAIYAQAVAYALSQDRSKIILYVSSTPTATPAQVCTLTRDLLHQRGIPAAIIHEGSTSTQRRRAHDAWKARSTATLINYMTLTEGFDATDVDCVILGRNTTSESTIIQMIGRGLRTHPGKTDCLVLDYTGRQDVHDIINYWRIDQGEPSGGTGDERAPVPPTEQELDRLQAAFPDLISAMGRQRAAYPWLTPFPQRRLRTLRLWKPDAKSGASDYLCVEPTERQRWKLHNVRITGHSSPRVARVARYGLSSSDAAAAVLDQIGELTPHLRRDALWRRQPATPAQLRLWTSVNDVTPPEDITRGEAADSIALHHFRRHVSPALV